MIVSLINQSENTQQLEWNQEIFYQTFHMLQKECMPQHFYKDGNFLYFKEKNVLQPKVS